MRNEDFRLERSTALGDNDTTNLQGPICHAFGRCVHGGGAARSVTTDIGEGCTRGGECSHVCTYNFYGVVIVGGEVVVDVRDCRAGVGTNLHGCNARLHLDVCREGVGKVAVDEDAVIARVVDGKALLSR